MSENPDAKITKMESIQDLIYAWERLSPNTILDSWSIYE